MTKEEMALRDHLKSHVKIRNFRRTYTIENCCSRKITAMRKAIVEEDRKTMDAVCPECGPLLKGEKVDEDGLCLSCGAQVAVGWFVKELWEELSAAIRRSK